MFRYINIHCVEQYNATVPNIPRVSIGPGDMFRACRPLFLDTRLLVASFDYDKPHSHSLATRNFTDHRLSLNGYIRYS